MKGEMMKLGQHQSRLIAVYHEMIRETGCPVCHGQCEFLNLNSNSRWTEWRCADIQCQMGNEWKDRYSDMENMGILVGKGEPKTTFKYIHLSLDDLYGDGYFYTEYNVSGDGHWVIINTEDKEKFLDAFAAEFRKRTEARLVGKNSEYLS